jgi:hypothetical protein
MAQPPSPAPSAGAAAADTPLAKLRARPVPELLPHLQFGAEAVECLGGEADAAAALQLLEQAGLHTEAVRLIAHALPRREAVWWACMCARHTAPDALPPADQRALQAAENWVFRGEDAARRAGFEHAQEANFASPEAWAAVAAFWSGDSMAPAGQAAVPPAPHLAGIAVAGSTLLAAVRSAPERRPGRMARFIESGRAIAGGGPGRLPPESA